MSGTIRDIKRLTGLSLATISKYLNGGNVLPQNRELIESAIKELDYEVNEVARWLATNKTKTIGVMVYDIQSLFNATLVGIIGKVLRKAGYGLLICDSANSLRQEQSNFEFLLSKKVDGILIVPIEHGEFIPEDTDIPIVFMDKPPASGALSCVKIDNVKTGFDAVEYLISNGHRRIGVISSYSEYTGRERHKGYLAAMEKHGLEVREEYIKIAPYAGIPGGHENMNELISLPEPPTAVFTTNYEITLGAIMAVNESHLKCPEEISLLGFDNLILPQIVKPKITTVVQPMNEIGETAVRLILNEIDKGEERRAQTINLTAHIQPGNSIRRLPE